MRIKQIQLRELAEYRRGIAESKRSLRHLEDQLKEREAAVIDALGLKAKVERGAITPAIDVKSRVAPKWKEEFAERLGPRAVQKVIEDTEPSLTNKLILIMDGEEV
ncbi:hypothetical protein IIA15_00295 [candidate division TA06 bacterium]|nr:hypothetical protein [candidate division TA06 bacterium]